MSSLQPNGLLNLGCSPRYSNKVSPFLLSGLALLCYRIGSQAPNKPAGSTCLWKRNTTDAVSRKLALSSLVGITYLQTVVFKTNTLLEQVKINMSFSVNI